MPRATKSSTAPITVFLGSDEDAVKSAALEASVDLKPADSGDFGLEIIDGAAENVASAIDRIYETISALQTFAFFGGGKLVWLKNVNFLSDSVIGRSENVISALEELAELLKSGLPAETRLLISAIDVDKRRSFYKNLGKLGDVSVFDRIDSNRSGWEAEATASVERAARERGLQFSEEASELLALLTGGDTRQVGVELEKIDLFLTPPTKGASAATYPEPRSVSVDLVRQFVPLSRAGVIFELGNALGQKDIGRCLRLVDQLLLQGESAVGILLVSIIPTVRNLLLAKDLIDRLKLPRPTNAFQFAKPLERMPHDQTQHLPRKKDGSLNAYGLGFAAVEVHRFSIKSLKSGLEACLEANLRLISGQLDERLVLEHLLIALAA